VSLFENNVELNPGEVEFVQVGPRASNVLQESPRGFMRFPKPWYDIV
jgi:hypothetical protein